MMPAAPRWCTWALCTQFGRQAKVTCAAADVASRMAGVARRLSDALPRHQMAYQSVNVRLVGALVHFGYHVHTTSLRIDTRLFW